MKQANDISEELKSMGSSLADMPRVMPYTIPDGYLENFASATLATIKKLNEPESVPIWGKAMPYILPEHYFEGLADEITIVASAEDLSSSLPKDMPLRAPAGYFESLPRQILMAAKATDNVKKETRIIPLKRSYFLRSVQWAIAAVLVLGVGFGSYRLLLNNGQTNNPEQILASVPGTEIQDYLQHTYRLDIDRVVTNDQVYSLNVDNKDIIQYLNETGWDATE